jgi:hypothetical protein
METRGHTSSDGRLRLDLDVGVADADVTVVVRVASGVSEPVDENGWPLGYFEAVAGSMPELERGAQGDFERRLPLE